MVQPAGEIWLGDVIRAVTALGPSDATHRAAIAELLGFRDIEHLAPLPNPDAVPTPPAPRDEPQVTLTPLVELIEPLARAHVGPSPAPPLESDRTTVGIPVVGTERCDWYDPLLDHATANRLLRTTLRTWCPYRTLAPRTAVRHLARLLPMTDLPRKKRLGYRRGGQLIIDLGPGTGPLARDQMDIADRVRQLSGQRIDVLGVSEIPPVSVSVDEGTSTSWRSYRLPANRAPVLILGVLGAVGPSADPLAATTEQWLTFTARLDRRGSDVTALVPMSPARLPRPLRHLLHALRWDSEAATRAVGNHPRTGRP